MSHEFERYCKDYEKIENYEKAKADNFKGWECHHRLETHTPDGIRREVDISYKELKALNLYYNRPASELIFLTIKDHNAYDKGKPKSAETRRKMKGNKNALGHSVSDESKKKIREGNKGKKLSAETRNKMKGNKNALGYKHSDETRKRMSEMRKGTHWYNNGKINIRAKECPEGFVPGRIKKP